MSYLRDGFTIINGNKLHTGNHGEEEIKSFTQVSSLGHLVSFSKRQKLGGERI